MRKCARGLCLQMVLVFFLVPFCYAAEFTDGVVASVAGEPILRSEIMQEIMPKVQNLTASGTSPEELERQIEPIFKEALESAIEHFILYKEAQTMKVEIPEAEVEKRVMEIRSQYDTPEAYQEALESGGYTMSNFRDRLRRQMMAISVGINKHRQFEKEAVISEEDISGYYREHEDEFRFPARFRASRIFIAAPRGETDERTAAREKLNALRGQILAGADLASLAREHSDGPEGKEGGMMGWIKPGDLVEPLGSALTGLKVGEVTEVLDTEFGVQLMRLEEIQEQGVMSYEDARKEIEPVLRQQRGEERYRQWMNTLRKRSNVRVFL